MIQNITTELYLDRILAKYRSFFDIKRDYEINGKKFSAYAYFESTNEKYVLTRKANLWRAKAFEHVVFLETEKCDRSIIEEIRKLIIDHMEPVFVRKGEKYPCEDHMYTYLTFVIILKEKPDKNFIRAVKHFHFDKGYLFNFRGHSEAHVICVDMESESVYTNFAANDLIKTYKEAFEDVREGKTLLSQMLA